jgi:uncharacterized protein YciI
MKVVNILRYIDDAAKIVALRPSHRAFMKRLATQGRVAEVGPFADGSDALFIYEVESLTEAESIVADNPYTIGGALLSYQLKSWQIVGSNLAMLTQSA